MFINMQGNAKKYLRSKLIYIQEKQQDFPFQNVPQYNYLYFRPYLYFHRKEGQLCNLKFSVYGTL